MTIVALTGVPGTGKTTLAEHLASQVRVVAVQTLAQDIGAVVERDETRGADVIDQEMLWDRARAALPDGDVLVEGGLAHFCDPDAVVLLRCHPDELRDRLEDRDWPEAKVDENVMAETLDAIAGEVETPRAWELDTTDSDPRELADRIAGLFRGEDLSGSGVHPLGGVDWTDLLLDEGRP